MLCIHTLLKGPDYLPSCLSGLILLVTRGKSFSKMKLGEQMVFFNENGGTLFFNIRDEELTLERVRKMYLTQLSSPFGF